MIISLKKSFTYYEKSGKERAEYSARIKRIPLKKRVYADESGINTFLRREYARAPRGDIIRDEKRGRKFELVNVIGAVCGKEYFGVECYRHTTDGAFFESWFEKRLLEKIPRGYTIIMDNAKFHRKKKLRKLARGKVRLLFLPSYSPDYNPIEKSWANMKQFLCNNLQDFKSVISAIYDYFGALDV